MNHLLKLLRNVSNLLLPCDCVTFTFEVLVEFIDQRLINSNMFILTQK